MSVIFLGDHVAVFRRRVAQKKYQYPKRNFAAFPLLLRLEQLFKFVALPSLCVYLILLFLLFAAVHVSK